MGRLREDWMALFRKRVKGRTLQETVRRGQHTASGESVSRATDIGLPLHFLQGRASTAE
jgi:hypothetical protein